LRNSDKTSGLLSFDFQAGVTVFIISLLIVAMFVPGLMAGLQHSRNIDFDAVAYRTGVILVEDPGQVNQEANGYTSLPEGAGMPGPLGLPGNISWDRFPSGYVDRIGLAVVRGMPNILSINKINQFFCTTAFTESDIRQKVIFSDYQYGFNITIQNITPMGPGSPPLVKSIGSSLDGGIYPTSNYGYIRRYVMIKQNPFALIDLKKRKEFNMTSDARVIQADQMFTVQLNGSTLYNRSIDVPYNLDLQTEPLIINITNLLTVMNNTRYNPTTSSSIHMDTPGSRYHNWTNASLASLTFTDKFHVPLTVQPAYKLAVDGKPFTPGIGASNSINLTAYLDAGMIDNNRDSLVNVDFQFKNDPDPPHILIGGTYLYDYNMTNVTRPDLAVGVLEVGIW
jgi:hypothetical protein